LQKYFDSLQVAPHAKTVDFGFFHEEGKGIRAIDQTGGWLESGRKRGKLSQIRLYTYADTESKVLHVFCAGDKTSQKKDIKFAQRCVDHLRKNQKPSNPR